MPWRVCISRIDPTCWVSPLMSVHVVMLGFQDMSPKEPSRAHTASMGAGMVAWVSGSMRIAVRPPRRCWPGSSVR